MSDAVMNFFAEKAVPWQEAWHAGVVPQVTLGALEQLREDLIADEGKILCQKNYDLRYDMDMASGNYYGCPIGVCAACPIALAVYYSEFSRIVFDLGKFNDRIQEVMKDAISFVSFIDNQFLTLREKLHLFLSELDKSIEEKKCLQN